MRKFDVEITRIGYGYKTIRVEADTEDEARQKALDEAGNHVFNEKSSEYEAQFAVEEV
jgi:hypothetical protein